MIAFDLSLTATGYAMIDEAGVLKPPELSGVERLQWIRDNVLRLARGDAVVVIEGYSFGSGHKAHNIGELGGVVRVALHEAGHTVVVIPPTSRAKYATGKGNAPKEQVLAEAIRRLGYTGHDHNVSDAMWLLAMAADQYNVAGRVRVPASHRTALKAVTWPAIGKQSK